MLDGVENTDPNYGTYLFQPSVDALQEFKVETSTYSAEYGHNLAQINVITKSRNESAPRIAIRISSQFRVGRSKLLSRDRARSIRHSSATNSAARLGGPVVIPKIVNGRNKLFFFFNYEGLRQVQAR